MDTESILIDTQSTVTTTFVHMIGYSSSFLRPFFKIKWLGGFELF